MKPAKLTLIGALTALGAWLGCGGMVVHDPGEPGSGGSASTTSSSATGNGSGSGTTTTGTGSATSSVSATSNVSSSGSGGPCACGDDCAATPTMECPFDVNDPFAVCAADVCAAEQMPCCAIAGCLELVNCARKTGCESLGCYNEATCKAEIDALGGITSEGVYAAQTMAECAFPMCGGCT